MKRMIAALLALACWTGEARAAEVLMKPFVLAWRGGDDPAAAVSAVTAKLGEEGFRVVGSYSPYPAATVIAATDDRLLAEAARSDFGGYGAALRVAVTRVGAETQVSYTNPRYFAQAYRMASDLAPVADRLERALGKVAEFGPKEGLPAKDLRSYRYMFGMERFSDPNLLAEHKSYRDAVAAVEKGLAARTMGVSKVYRIDLPGKDETVFGVALAGAGGDQQQDDAYIMTEIDFKELKSTAHLPYEVLVSGGKVYALSARFRIAIDFPDLSMMGSNSFMNIMGSPDAIRTALSKAAGGDWDVLKAQ